MASIWIEAKKGQPEKIIGHLPTNRTTTARFKIEVAKAAHRYNADVTYADDMNALLQPRPAPDGDTVVTYHPIAMWVESLSPPSAPEPNQPKIMAGKGVLVTAAKLPTNIHQLGVPK